MANSTRTEKQIDAEIQAIAPTWKLTEEKM